jgi:hypothetical protein
MSSQDAGVIYVFQMIDDYPNPIGIHVMVTKAIGKELIKVRSPLDPWKSYLTSW